MHLQPVESDCKDSKGFGLILGSSGGTYILGLCFHSCMVNMRGRDLHIIFVGILSQAELLFPGWHWS